MDEIVYYDGLGENVIVNGPCCSHLSARPCASGKELADWLPKLRTQHRREKR